MVREAGEKKIYFLFNFTGEETSVSVGGYYTDYITGESCPESVTLERNGFAIICS